MRRMNSVGRAALCVVGLVLILAGQTFAQAWSEATPAGGPPAATSDFGSALFDPASDRMIIFGGGLNGAVTAPYDSNAVWVLTGADGLGGTPEWIELSPTGTLPAPRKGQSTVYDASNNRMIVFGGCPLSCGAPLNDVWVLTNANGLGGTPAWEELSPTGGPPAARANQTAVYDPTTNTMIIFGGQNGSTATPPTFSDVWVLSNANGLGGTPVWTELSPTGGPPAGQSSPSGVYDAANNRMIVFGGGLTNGGGVSNAVWMLSSANGQGGSPVWTNLIAEGAAGSPPARAGHTAVYDPSSNRMTVFGGNGSGTFYNDTWLLTDANGLGGTPTWTQFTPTGGPPAVRTLHGALFNPLSDRMTIFGGGNATVNFTDTWVLTNANGSLTPALAWTESTPTGGPPAPRAEFVSVLDLATDRMIVFGGITPNPTPPSTWNTNDVWVLTNADGLGGTPQWVQLSPTPDPTNGLPYPRHWHSTVYDPSSNRIIVFGGCLANCTQASPPSPTNDVWVLTNANGLGGTPAWIELFPAGGPPAPRASHTAVYDPGTNSLIIFGGQNGATATPPTYSDVWVLGNANGLGGTPTWTELSPTGGPPSGQASATAVYDQANNRMVVFGGEENDSAVRSNAVWVLSNANGQEAEAPGWTNLIAEAASGSPQARSDHTAVYDQTSNRMTMFGGIGIAGTYYNDAWLLTNANGLGGAPTWMQLTPSGGPPAARSGQGAVFNPASARMTVFAGGSSTGNLNDTWVLSNANAVTGPVVGLSATTLTFASEVVGTTSTPQAIMLFNPGDAELTISTAASSGDFAETNTCDTTLAAEGECAIIVTFEPTATGPRTGTVTITDNADNSPQTLSLAGMGTSAPSGWQVEPGALSQVSVGSDGTVWGINSAGQAYFFNPQTQTWQQAPGLFTQIAVGASGLVWALNAAGQIYRYDPATQSWDQVPGALSQIAVGSDGDVWGISSSGQVYHFNPATQNLVQIPGTLAQIAVGYDGAVWGTSAAQQIFRFNPGTQSWQPMPGALKQIAVGADGDVWGINNAGQVYHFNTLTQRWNNTPGSLAQIAVGSASNVWGIDATGAIWRFNAQAQAWDQIPGQLAQIAVGANGAVWGVNSANQVYQFVEPTEPTQTLHQIGGAFAQIATGIDGEVWAIDATQQIWRYDAQRQSLEQIPGALSQISVGFGGNVWGLDAAGQVWQFNPSGQGWEQIPGSLAQLEVGADGSVWGIDSADRIWRFNPSTQGFQQIPGSLAQLAVGADGTVWGLNSVGQIWRFNPSTQGWVQIPGSLAQIAVGSANNVWGLNAAGQIWRYDPELQTWDSIPGSLTSIAVAFDGTVWGLNSANQIWRFNAATQSWDSISGALSQISVGADAVVWGLNASGQAYQYW